MQQLYAAVRHFSRKWLNLTHQRFDVLHQARKD